MQKLAIINLVKILGMGYSEIIVDLQIKEMKIDSIEIVNDDIILHTFINDFDYQISIDSISKKNIKYLVNELKKMRLT